MNHVALSKAQIDKLGIRLATGNYSLDDLRALENYRRGFRYSYNYVLDICRKCTESPVSGRPSKSTTAIIEKLQRESVRLSQIQDIAGCRIVVEGAGQQELAAETLERQLMSSKRFDRRQKTSHGYRAIHFVSLATELPVEIQIRTALQHQWSELSEKLADLMDKRIKYGHGNSNAVAFLCAASVAVSNFEEVELARYRALLAIKKIKSDLPKSIRDQINAHNQRYYRLRRKLKTLFANLPVQAIAAELSP